MSKRSAALDQFLKTRKRIREMKAEASSPLEGKSHIESLLQLYHDLLLRAESNIICPPEIIDGYFFRRLAVYHEVLHKHGRAPHNLEELRKDLLERSRQRNEDAKAAWRRAFEEHCSDSTIPLYYVRPSAFTRFSGDHYTPVSQVPLLSHLQDHPTLLSETTAWLEFQASRYRDSLTQEQRLALAAYCFRDYVEVWQAFNDNKVPQCEKAAAIAAAFDQPWTQQHTLPRRMCVFEGQGFHDQENDIAALQLTEDQLPYTLHSRRPRSTSLVPNIALLYTGGSIKQYKPFEPPVSQWISISPRDAGSFGDWANHHRLAMAGGCLVRYQIVSDIPAMSMWTTANYLPEEAEVLLPPGCTITIFKIERNVEMATRRIDDPSVRLPQCFYDVYHAYLSWEK